MLFDELIPFEEALQDRRLRALLPTTLSSKELEAIRSSIADVALVSARVTNAPILQKVLDVSKRILTTQTTTRDGGRLATVGLDPATARAEIKDLLEIMAYKPEPGEAGTIKDLSSDQRLNLIVKTTVDMAQGYGYWQQGQDSDLLRMYPAYEFYRAEHREEPRDWPTVWAAHGGRFYVGKSDYPQGRMVALKDDPIWVSISRFGTPYPPFDFNSGMDIKDVKRKEAIRLGLMSEHTVVNPIQRQFGQDFESAQRELSPELQDALLQSVGQEYEFVDGVLVKKAANERQDLTTEQRLNLILINALILQPAA